MEIEMEEFIVDEMVKELNEAIEVLKDNGEDGYFKYSLCVLNAQIDRVTKTFNNTKD